MAVRPRQIRRRATAVMTAGAALALWVAGPVLAAPDRDGLCDEQDTLTLEISATELTATPVNSSDELLNDHLLRPRAKSAVRAAFADDEADAPLTDDSDTEDEVVEEIESPVVPSALERQPPSPFKRQMYRRDI